MNRSLKLSMLMALALGSSQVLALDLGQIRIKSALGQPLLAEIPLTKASPAELQNLSARLATNEEFARAGIVDGRPNIPLQFSIADENGHKVIRITSNVSVDNPYLDLLVEVSSSAGSSVHEYAILLDPPSKVAQAPVSSAPATHHAARVASAAAGPAPARPSHKAAAAPARQAAAPAAVKNGEYGPVGHGQTLSTVAHATAPAGVDVNQMMLALKAANPDAFYRDNINALKAGAVLRVPSREDAQAIALATAAATVRQQNSDWRSGAVRTPTTVAAGATRSSEVPAPTGAATGDRLALVPAKNGGQGAAGSGGKHESAAGLRLELQRNQETLASLQQQGADLKSRLKDLEDVNSKNERLLSLKDNEIAELQQKLAAARKAAGLPATPVAAPSPAAPAHAASSVVAAPAAAVATPPAEVAKPASTAAVTTTPLKSEAAPASSVAASATHAPVAAAKPAPKPVTHKPVAPAPAPEEPWYTQAWAMLAGLAAVVILLLLALRGRRRKPATAPAMAAATPSLADRFGSAPAIGDADPDQDELLDQLAEHPDDIGLHLELVSLYYSRRDVEHFEAAAEAMHAHISDPHQDEWQDVLHMGEDLVPGHPLFSHVPPPLPPQGEDEHAALHQFDLGSYADEHAATSEPATPARPKVSEYHFDFNLTPQQAQAATAAKRHEPASAAEDETVVSSWKFDEPAETAHAAPAEHEFGELRDDPIDTKLDLARAYLDMGDPDGARAMLDEVMHEGTQMQKDVAKGLLDKLR